MRCKGSSAVLAAVFCRLLTAQTSVGPAPEVQHALQYVLGPDDQIRIWARGVEEISSNPIRITPSGDINLPIAGLVHAAGLSIEQLTDILVKRLSKEVLHPQVSVEMVDFGSEPVSIIGAVTRPGVHQLRGRKTLAEVVALAEGLKEDAGPRIKITRQSQYGAVPLPSATSDPTGRFSVAEVDIRGLLAGGHPEENIPIYPHDVITVPRAERVYVVGEVKKPGEVFLKDGDSISVLQALASAQGLGPTPSSPQHARIIHVTPDSASPREIEVNLRKIQAGQAPDVSMGPNDILVIPVSGSKKAMARAIEAAIQTATGVAIWRMP